MYKKQLWQQQITTLAQIATKVKKYRKSELELLYVLTRAWFPDSYDIFNMLRTKIIGYLKVIK